MIYYDSSSKKLKQNTSQVNLKYILTSPRNYTFNSRFSSFHKRKQFRPITKKFWHKLHCILNNIKEELGKANKLSLESMKILSFSKQVSDSQLPKKRNEVTLEEGS